MWGCGSRGTPVESYHRHLRRPISFFINNPLLLNTVLSRFIVNVTVLFSTEEELRAVIEF